VSRDIEHRRFIIIEPLVLTIEKELDVETRRVSSRRRRLRMMI